MSLEGPVKKAILDYLEARGLIAVRIQSGGAHGGRMRLAKAGTADIFCVLPGGRAMFVEAKRTTGGKQSAEQKAFEAKARGLGAVYLLANSVDVVAQWIAQYGILRNAA